ncbi:4-hydroxybenzoate polyprenyltransferase, mitochondrial [Streptomyces violaceorubidus]
MTSASAALPQQPGRTKAFLRLVMIEHSVFALPFAYIAALTAMYQRDGNIHWGRLLLVTVAMVGLRTFAMAVNRIIDREIDARNPRTAHRELVTGTMSVKHTRTGALIALVVFLGAAALLNPLCLALAPVAVIPMVVYPYGKRFTNFPQAILGLAQAMGPVGADWRSAARWSSEAVILGLADDIWIRGFDSIYTCQDIETDRHRRREVEPRPLRRAGRDPRRPRLPHDHHGPVRLILRRHRRRRLLLARPADRRGRVPLRAHHRPPHRPDPPQQGVLLGQRLHRHRPVRVRAAGSARTGPHGLKALSLRLGSAS